MIQSQKKKIINRKKTGKIYTATDHGLVSVMYIYYQKHI